MLKVMILSTIQGSFPLVRFAPFSLFIFRSQKAKKPHYTGIFVTAGAAARKRRSFGAKNDVFCGQTKPVMLV